MHPKPTNPYPRLLRRVLRRVLPERVFRRHIGRHEEFSLQLWRHLCARLGPGEAILDIGAYHGEFSLAAREVNSESPVFAFEPNPESLTVLRRSCAGQNVTICDMAVGEEDGETRFVCNAAKSRVAEGSSVSGSATVRVPVRSLDSWCGTEGMRVALLKIDTEGFEGSILRGGKNMLTECRPIILCEVLSDPAGRQVMDALTKDYGFHDIVENHGLESRPEITRRQWRNKNWLLLPRSQTDSVPERFFRPTSWRRQLLGRLGSA